MKVELLRLNTANKASPISEGVAEIRINTQSCKGINLTTQHNTRRSGGHHEWQPFTTQSKSQVGSYLTLVSYSTHMPRRTHRGWPDTIPYNIHKEVGYRPTRRHAKLLSLGIPYVSYAPVHSMLVHQGLTDVGLNWHRRGLPPWSSEYQIRSLILLPVQYSPFSPNCPARSPIMTFYQLFKFSTFHFTNQGIKVLNLTSGVCHRLLPEFYPLSIALLMDFSTTIGSRW
jgi:hypothetical protein